MSKPEIMLDDNSPDLAHSDGPPDASTERNSGLIWVAFGSILLAELGDKTQLATMLLSARSHSPIATFVGASLALILTSLLGVLAGQWIAKRISPALLNWLAGGGFVLIGLSILWQALHDWSA